jgi:hypothetical protein
VRCETPTLPKRTKFAGRCALALLLGALTASVPRTAIADARADAQALFARGNQLAGDGDFAAALESFRAAYARYPSAKILLNIGTSLRQLGRNAEAADVYEAYIGDPEANPPRVEELKRILREIDALVAKLRIEVSAPGAELRVDGRVMSGSAQSRVLRVDPGEHTVSADKPGLVPSIRTVTVSAREERTVNLDLVPPGTKVVVRPAGKDPGSGQRAVAFIVGGAGIAGIGVGSVFGILAKTKSDAADEHCLTETRCDGTGVALGDTADTHAKVATVAWVVGAAALATAVTLFITAPTRKKPASSGASVGASSTGSGVRLETRW